MKIFNKAINFAKNTDLYKEKFNANNLTLTPEESILLKTLGININDLTNDSKGEVVYFTCLKILSETIGKMPLNMFQESNKGVKKVNDNNWNMIKIRPNGYMSSTTFWTTLELHRNHYGNAYAYLNFKGSKLKDMWILEPNNIRIMVDNDGIFGKDNALWYVYNEPKTGKEYVFNKDEILHFKSSNTENGLVGIPVRDTLSSLFQGNMHQQNFLTNLYKNGLSAGAILEYTGDLNREAQSKLVDQFASYGTGSSNAGNIIPVPVGMSLKPLDIKLTDSQFESLKKLTANQIAGAFGLSPTFINNYEKSSYSNSESEMLAFLINTLQYILKMYEDEISYKLLSDNKIQQGYYYKFNEGVLLRTDMKTQAEILAGLHNNAIKTSNECRLMLGLETKPEGDKLVCNGNYIPLEMVGQQYIKGGENKIE